MIFFIYITIFLEVANGHPACEYTSSEGIVYDVSALEVSNGGDDYKVMKSDSTGTFYYNICGPIQQAHGKCVGSLSMAMLDEGMFCANIADETNFPEWALLESGNPQAGISATWTGSPCSTGYYTTTLQFKCDMSKESGQAISAVSGLKDCNYILEIPSKYGCPISSGLSGGFIFIIIFFSVCFVYFVGGIIYNKKIKGADGKELIPNFDKWELLPGLVKDGCMFTHAKIKGLSKNKDDESDALI